MLRKGEEAAAKEGGEKVRVDRLEAEAARRSRELVGRRKEYQAVKKFPSWQEIWVQNDPAKEMDAGGRAIKWLWGWLQRKREGTIAGQVGRR